MRTVFINGCFDVLHRGHIEMLQYAASLGSILIVAIDSDVRVKKLKGEQRPFNTLEDRKFVLSSIGCVDKVLSFSTEKELEQLIKKINPDIMVIGSDWKHKPAVGSEYAKELKYFERIKKYSTTKILQNSFDR